MPELYSSGQFNPDFRANYQRDIQPIVERLSRYQWVSNVQAMNAFNSRQFDYADNSEANLANRQQYFSYFRGLNKEGDPSPDQPQQVLFKDNFPMLPLNSGSNSVSNDLIMKFLALNETQQFLLSQWAAGRFDNRTDAAPFAVHPLDQGSVGNCVGLPMCPGIEVTWSMQNPAIYAAPYQIADEMGPNGYQHTGLTPSRDECAEGSCQPGDLTKRMACPWQADFFQCTVQTVNFTVPEVNKTDGKPLPPTYYAYWWPPQSPWDVLTGDITAAGQAASHLPAGNKPIMPVALTLLSRWWNTGRRWRLFVIKTIRPQVIHTLLKQNATTRFSRIRKLVLALLPATRMITKPPFRCFILSKIPSRSKPKVPEPPRWCKRWNNGHSGLLPLQPAVWVRRALAPE